MAVTVGQRASRRLTLTPEHVEKFAEISGDRNPLHFDEAFAGATKFGRLVVQGGLTTGLLHALVAMDLLGPGTVFLSQNWKFTAPVFIGDTVHLETEVIAKEERRPGRDGVVTLQWNAVNQNGKTVMSSQLKCLMGHRPKEAR